ncbi:ATP-binding cassette domain-containing protein [Shigella flexneri]
MALVGENGAGKSTMMKVLTGILVGMSARFYGWGRKCIYRAEIFPGSRIGIIHQELNLFRS